VNGVSGIAVGFKASILPRKPKDLAKAVAACIDDREKYLKLNKIILPTFPDFRGDVEHVEGNQYLTRGKVDYIGKYTYNISEVPVGHDRASYLKILNDLYEADKIKDYDDKCSGAGFGFDVKVSVSQKVEIDKDPVKFFKLEKTYTEILTTIGYDGKLKIFQNVSELVDYFVTYRTSKFGDKIEWEREVLKSSIKKMNHKQRFIQAIVDRSLVPSGMKKLALEAWITNNIDDSDEARKLAALPLYSCTIDEVEKLKSEIMEKYAILAELLKTNATIRYKEVLNGMQT
jgi:DNA gyrase/topoisomerase IV subunit A